MALNQAILTMGLTNNLLWYIIAFNMKSPEARASLQPQAIEPKFNRFKKLGLKAGVGILSAATLFGARGTLPTDASSNLMLKTASSEGPATSCIPASDELFGNVWMFPPLAAAVEKASIDGIKALTIKSIFGEDIVIIQVPDCPPVVVEPTPKPILSIKEGIIDAPYQKTELRSLNKYIHQVFKTKAPSDILDTTSEYHDINIKVMETLLDWAKNGAAAAGNPKTILNTRISSTNDISMLAYHIYQESGVKEYLIIAQKARWNGETEFGKKTYDKTSDKSFHEEFNF